MKVRISTSFRDRLNKQVEYIAKDKPHAARMFKTEILKQIKDIPQMPYRYRKSIFFDRDDIRDLVLKGYVIPIVYLNTLSVYLNIYSGKCRYIIKVPYF